MIDPAGSQYDRGSLPDRSGPCRRCGCSPPPRSSISAAQDSSSAAGGRRLLSVVLSFRNEALVIPELIARLTRVLGTLPYAFELIFVNDASTDGSLDILLEEAAADKRIKIITMSRTFGVAPCVMAGFSHAAGDAVIYLDADLQDPPEVVPELVKKWEGGADVVHTTRTRRLGESAVKMWLTRLAYRIISLVSELDIPENTGDFKLLSRRAVVEMLRLKEHDPFLRGLSLWIGFKQDRVLYTREARFAGRTHFPLLRSLNPVREFIRGLTSFSTLPLYVALAFGFLVSVAAFIGLGYIICAGNAPGMYQPGQAALLVTMLFLGGTILFAIGVLGIYVDGIHRALKVRPPYIIESSVGFDDD